MVKDIEHIGIVVADLDASLQKYTNLLGLELAEIEEVEVEGVVNRVAFLPLKEINIELIQTTGSEGIVADFLKQKGEGIHHIAFNVDNLNDIFKELCERGVKFMWDKILPGSRESMVAFIEPSEFNGTYIELIEKPE